MKKNSKTYDEFIRAALDAGFTHEQVTFLEKYLYDEMPGEESDFFQGDSENEPHE